MSLAPVRRSGSLVVRLGTVGEGPIMKPSTTYDVAIIGGGPAGATAATLLRKYNPALSVAIIEKEQFPRDHIGESQLPSIMPILHEMGAWDKVEQAGFPVKIGASYTWGRTLDQWDFEFYPVELWKDEPRPGRYEGQRVFTAFQVDRAIYDEILLNHAREAGATVLQPEQVEEVLTDADSVAGLRLRSGATLTARHYIDASGVYGIVRRAMNIGSWVPEELKNIAVWRYWRNTEWAVRIGVGATRVQVRSLPYGWIWFIPLGPDRTSIGLVIPAEHYKRLGLSPEQVYAKAIAEQSQISNLVANATAEEKVYSCKDWSHLADRIVGNNWMLVGEACGFADPILAAGMSLAHSSARDAAYSVLELERGELDAGWIRSRFNERNRTNIEQHIRFAQYWYAANSCFTDLQAHCASIAKEAGLNLRPDQAWRWLSQGGFATQSMTHAALGSFDIASAKQLLGRFHSEGRTLTSVLDGYNVFKLNLQNAVMTQIGELRSGRIHQAECYERGGKKLPLTGVFGQMVAVLKTSTDASKIFGTLQALIDANVPESQRAFMFNALVQALEVLVQDYWVLREKDKKRPLMAVDLQKTRYIRSVEETAKAVQESGATVPIVLNM